MKKSVLVIGFYFFILSVCFGSSETAVFNLEDLNFNDDIYLYGVTSSADFFYPLYYADEISNAEFSLIYNFTQFVGLDSLYTVFINNEPVYTSFFNDYDGSIRIKIPDRYLQTASLLKITVTVILDYSICDNKKIDTKALWFRIDRNTTLAYDYEPVPVHTIPEFFSIYNPKKTYGILVEDVNEKLQAIVNIGEYLGYSGKSVKQRPVISDVATADINNIIMTEQLNAYAISVKEEILYIDPNADVYNSFNPLYYNYAPSSSLTVLELNTPERRNVVPLSSFGVTDSSINVVYGAIRTYDFGIDAFGGVPQDALLNLNFSVSDRIHDSGNTLSVYINGYLLESYHLNDLSKDLYTDSVRIPSSYFKAFNTLTFDMKNMMSNCDAFTVTIYPNSTINFSTVKALDNTTINDFPNNLYGNTLYVVSEKDELHALNLLQISFEKGKSSVFPDRGHVFTVEEVLENTFDFEKYDGIVFLLLSDDVEKVDELLNLSDSFTLKADDGSVLFSALSNGDFDIIHTFDYKGLPAILFTHYGKDSLQIDPSFISEIKRIPGNLGILTEHEVFSFEIGPKNDIFFLSAAEETENERLMTFWERYRLWIILALSAILLIILLVSYRKTSKGR